MYQKAYGIIETLAPLHVGASAGEETGNLNLIFRDQFTKTGIIPGSSIRGRFRADMRSIDTSDNDLDLGLTNDCYGHESDKKDPESTTEAQVKFEYASLVWLPVFCPGQPVVWVTCPRLLRRYKQVAQLEYELPKHYTVQLQKPCRTLFFNLGHLTGLRNVRKTDIDNLEQWIPENLDFAPNNLVVVGDNDINIIHEMSLYRQSRTKLENDVKKVENFFGIEALPEGSILAFPVAIKQKNKERNETEWKEALGYTQWEKKISDSKKQILSKELYFGGLESIGFGRCHVTLAGKYFNQGDK